MAIEYDDYKAFCPNRLTEDEFKSLLPNASAYMDVITHNRWQNVEGWKRERAVQALFAVINEMAAAQSVSNGKGARLQSVSNDGYSESYASDADGGAIRRAAHEWLSGTGLVSAL